MAWCVIGSLLQEEREKLGVTRARMAKLLGVSHRTIERFELAVERKTTLQFVHDIARVLDCKADVFARYSSEGGESGSSPQVPARRPPAGQVVEDLSEDRPPTAPRVVRMLPQRPIEQLTVQVLNDIAAAYRAQDGRRFLARVRVKQQHPISTAEWIALGCKPGEGAMFVILNGSGRGLMRLTIYTADVESTRALQAKINGGPLQVVLAITVVDGPADHPTMSNETQADRDKFRKEWKGFWVDHGDFVDEPVPWTFVVEEVRR